MPTTWTIAVDWDRNNDFTGTFDNVTSRVISAKWALGLRTPYANTANEATLDLVLENTDRRYSPDNYIIGEAHELTQGATLWQTTWYLEPVPAALPWQLGVAGRAELGTATRLAY